MARNLIINVYREGYDPSQIDRTMTVGKLIRYLKEFDHDKPVYIGHDNHYTFSGITYGCFEEDYGEEDE